MAGQFEISESECGMTALPRTSSYQRAAERTIEVLLNCYIREYAQPKGALQVLGRDQLPTPLMGAAAALRLEFPHLGKTCLVAIELPLRSCYHYRSEPYLLGPSPLPRVLDWQALATLIIDELSSEYPQAFNAELLHQVGNSFAHMQQFLAHLPSLPLQGEPLQIYLRSERSLAAGHRHHPTPKAREGMDEHELFQYSPELGGEFQLEYFAVRAQDFLHRNRLGGDQIALLQSQLSGFQEECVVGIHPWQAGFLRGQAPFQKALQSAWIRPLGRGGVAYQATASVRTLFCPDFPWFAKLSLHMRLTNCLRKNAWYELESALLLDEVLGGLEHPFGLQRFGILGEPAFTTVDIAELPDTERRFLREAFATLFRDNGPIVHSREPLLMAAALFGGRSDTSWLEQLVANIDPREWLADYCRSVVWPALYYYAEYGVVFEPHLQNTLLRLKGGRPAGALFRDLEGTKLVRDIWAQRLQGRVDPQILRSVLYSQEQAWCRFCYCLIFNQLAEVVDHLPGGDCQQLWGVVRQSLQDYLGCHGSGRSLPLVRQLLEASRLPFKANLLTRFLRERDSRATYLWIENPLRR